MRSYQGDGCGGSCFPLQLMLRQPDKVRYSALSHAHGKSAEQSRGSTMQAPISGSHYVRQFRGLLRIKKAVPLRFTVQLPNRGRRTFTMDALNLFPPSQHGIPSEEARESGCCRISQSAKISSSVLGSFASSSPKPRSAGSSAAILQCRQRTQPSSWPVALADPVPYS